MHRFRASPPEPWAERITHDICRKSFYHTQTGSDFRSPVFLAEHSAHPPYLPTDLPAVGLCIRIVRGSDRLCKGTPFLSPAGGTQDICGFLRTRFPRFCPLLSQKATRNLYSHTAIVLTSHLKRDRLSQSGIIFPEILVPQAFGVPAYRSTDKFLQKSSRNRPNRHWVYCTLLGKFRRKEYSYDKVHTRRLSLAD